MKTKWLINPYERIAGWQALLIGIVVMALTAVIGKLNHVAFDGALDVHSSATFSFSTSFIMQGVNFLILFLTMWLAGACFSKSKVRAIDVAGTMSLARAPMLLLVIICFLPVVPASLYDIPRLFIFVAITIPLIIWMIALMYHAYSVSCHLKGSRAIISFIGVLLVAEIISKCIYIFLLSSLFINTPVTTGTTETNAANSTVAVADSITIRQTAEKVVKSLEQGDFDAIESYFDENMKKKVPASGLKMGWVQINMMYGKYKSADLNHAKESVVGEIRRLEIPCTFEKGQLYLRLTFNKNGTICGMFIGP